MFVNRRVSNEYELNGQPFFIQRGDTKLIVTKPVLSIKRGNTFFFKVFNCLKNVLEKSTSMEVKFASNEEIVEGFSFNEYFDSLRPAKRLGRFPFWAQVLSSSYSICQG